MNYQSDASNMDWILLDFLRWNTWPSIGICHVFTLNPVHHHDSTYWSIIWMKATDHGHSDDLICTDAKYWGHILARLIWRQGKPCLEATCVPSNRITENTSQMRVSFPCSPGISSNLNLVHTDTIMVTLSCWYMPRFSNGIYQINSHWLHTTQWQQNWSLHRGGLCLDTNIMRHSEVWQKTLSVSLLFSYN